jgi:hypothetical protein
LTGEINGFDECIKNYKGFKNDIMKKIACVFVLCTGLAIVPTQRTHAAIWLVVQAALKKAIKAIDLAIQQQQNKVIWLQNAQKEMENVMSKLKLNEISDWVEKQRTLYKDYFDELQKVKDIITYYDHVKQITTTQQSIINEYKKAFALFSRDDHFSAEEMIYMGQVYDGMLDASAKSLDGLMLVINSFVTQMTDAKRMEIINGAASSMNSVYNDLKLFNSQNILLSLQRTKDKNDINALKALYNLK